MREYIAIVGKRFETEINESFRIRAKNMDEAERLAKLKVPACWEPVIRDIWRI